MLTTDRQMLEDTPAQYKIRMQEHAEKTLGAVSNAAKAAGVYCDPDERWVIAVKFFRELEV